MTDAAFLTASQLFEQRAARHPGRTAIVFKDRSVSYGELDRRVGTIARQLQVAGVRRNTLVGLHVERSVEMVVAMLAIHKAGGAYVPLDPGFPKQRLDDIVEDARLEFLVHSGRPSLGTMPPRAVDLSSIGPPDQASEALVVEPAGPRDLCYVMYTSGSTGKPKGVMIPHGAVMNFLESMRATPGLSEEDVLVAVTTTSFDISVLELFLPLITGARIVLAAKDETIDGRKLARLIDANAATLMQATPATWRMLFLGGWTGSSRLVALCGGEILDNNLAQQLVPATRALWNMYGPTETTVWSTCGRISDPRAPISVGLPILDTTVHVLDERLAPVPAGISGELYIGGAGVALGYTSHDLTVERFIADPFSGREGARLYRTGDIAEIGADGQLRIIGRADEQVKVRGFRVELNDVQKHLLECPGIRQAAVVARSEALGGKELAAYVVMEAGVDLNSRATRDFMAARLPDYMVPTSLVALETLPLTPNGKVDKKALSTTQFPEEEFSNKDSRALEPSALLNSIVARVLGQDAVDPDANLFELGVNSLKANYIAATFTRLATSKLSVGEIFEHPTINGVLAHQGDKQYLLKVQSEAAARVNLRRRHGNAAADEAIAIVGMAGRFPGADSLEELWRVFAEGRDTVTRFAPDQDDPAIDADVRAHPNYIRARGMIKNPDLFDAAFFGVSPNDAAVMDPQQRIFLEIAWEAMENANCDPDRFEGLIGVYAGMGNNLYYTHNVSTRPNLIRMVGEVQVEIGREKDHIATLVSHKLNLTGPSVSVHTACSTGLVCVDNACHSLLSFQCDMALAGAINLRTPQMAGQMHEPSGIFSGDGHCRPFSDNASGTMFSDSAGIVVLKRLSDAIAARDTIYAVVKGTAVNHDGLSKKSYLAPSVKAQMEVIATAQARAGVAPSSVSYMEAHGTATPVGDPIEFQALRNVFELGSTERNFCALGSSKANLGHPTTAAGVVGVIKAALALRHRQIPPMANFNAINPNIDIASSPFFIPTRLMDWPEVNSPRRAGVSSFGFCGTNAHAVIEEFVDAPRREAASPVRPWLPILASASTETAFAALSGRLADFAVQAPAPSFNDMSFTLATGRKHQKFRGFALAGSGGDSAGRMESFSPPRRALANGAPHLAFVFPGQGAQYLGMGRDLYETEAAFRQAFDECADLLVQHVGHDLRKLVLGRCAQPEESAAREQLLNSTQITQPAMFSLEYSLARLWMSWGLQPSILLGHSVGEYVGCVLAGVLSLQDGLKVIAARGRLMGEMARGSMLSVRLAGEAVQDHLKGTELCVAAINSPALSVVAGPTPQIDALKERLDNQGIRSQKLATSHAFHSAMMKPAVEPFRQVLQGVALNPPKMRIISTVTGVDLRAEQAMDPDYWASHITLPVEFCAAIKTLWEMADCVMLEVGPRGSMSTLAMTQVVDRNRQAAIASLQDSSENHAESLSMAKAVGQLWQNQIELDWPAYFADAEPRRVALPTYPFERKRYWVDPAPAVAGSAIAVAAGPQVPDIDKAQAATQAEPGDLAALREDLLEELKGILEEVSGENMQHAVATASFFELGLDSLLLTPVTYLLKERFGVTVTFRQLLSDFSTLETLSNHILSFQSEKTLALTAEAARPVAALQAQESVQNIH